ncbi:uncharacterized protein LOC101680073 isoform X4 [Mustela putorius furo]|uniref:Uncharacterized protein LOC101680073 isoform X4 n=1 Tax=Mustela putorius furo TaxID=9669 RepID=A0A8U0UXM2_MUSPF|nr:uncharacterized protein LOC101680073 isoform X4 [Mustela putorius furo]
MAVVRTSSSWISKVVPSLLLPTWAVGSGASLSQPAEAGAGIAFGACGGLWTLGILLFVTLFLTNRGRAQRFLRGQLTHIVAWTWAFHVGLTVNLVWVWYRFQGLDRSQRTHWTDRLSWILLTFLPTVPLAVVITVSAVLLIKGRVSFQLSVPARSHEKKGASGTLEENVVLASPALGRATWEP